MGCEGLAVVVAVFWIGGGKIQMTIKAKGVVHSYLLHESFIHSAERH